MITQSPYEGIARAVVTIVRRAGPDETGLLAHVLECAEKPLFEAVLDHTAGNQARAAQILGVSRTYLARRMRQLGVAVPDTAPRNAGTRSAFASRETALAAWEADYRVMP